MSVFKIVHCPSCGASTDVKNPAVLQATCAYCSTVFIFDNDAVKDTGKKSRLMPSISGFQVGMSGKLKGKPFTVLGRVQYKYGLGSAGEELGKWDEWYIELPNGDTAWIFEDMGELIYEEALDMDISIKVSDLKPGSKFKVKGKEYQIKEYGRATCAGAEGMLPFEIIPGENYPFVDGISLSDNSYVSAEFEDDEVLLFTGRVLTKNELQYTKEIKAEEKRESEAIRCPSCGHPLETRNMNLTEFTITCSACSSVSQFSENVGTALGKVKQELAEPFKLDLGVSGKLLNKDWTIVGRIRRDWSEEGESGYEVEYLLYNPEDGYIWLTEEENHYYICVPSDEKPASTISNNSYTPKSKIKFGNTTYFFFEAGQNTLTYVDGVLPWFAKIGEVTRYADCINPPYLVTEELLLDPNDNSIILEIDYSKSTYIDYHEVEKAFNVSLPSTYNVGNAQPYKPVPMQKLISILSYCIGFFLLYTSCNYGNMKQDVLNKEFQMRELRLNDLYTESFKIDKADETLNIEVYASVDNSWTSVGVALFDESKEAVISDEELAVEYYHGVEDGESWSEGSRTADFYWKIKTPGNYKLMLAIPPMEKSEMEADFTASGTVSVKITKGVYKSGWLGFWGFMWLLQPVFLWMKKKTFESSRWGKVIESDSDDDD